MARKYCDRRRGLEDYPEEARLSVGCGMTVPSCDIRTAVAVTVKAYAKRSAVTASKKAKRAIDQGFYLLKRIQAHLLLPAVLVE